jgi:N-methylhydantoinase A/oxoprolinase/acetone carboxylase beta subunit
MSRVPKVLAIDAGGTMTDTFIVDETGEFVVGKAQTTPHDGSRETQDRDRTRTHEPVVGWRRRS